MSGVLQGPLADSSAEEQIPPEIAAICSALIRFDTTNFEPGHARGESGCVDYLESLLDGTPFERIRLEAGPGRSNLIIRVPGRDPSAPGVVCHGHLDVVPADPDRWSFDPFAGDIVDGYVQGRGAVDMKDFVAAMACVLLDWSRGDFLPTHPTVFAFVADEETDGSYGAAWLVRQHPDLFDGVRYALGESGGMLTPWTDAEGNVANVLPIAVAERGTCHLRLLSSGTSGHASESREDNAVVRLADAISRLGHYDWPVELTTSMRACLDAVSLLRGADVLDGIDLAVPGGLDALLRRLGPLASVVRRAFRPSTVPTMLTAGYKVNVIPEEARASVDVRTLPGDEETVLAAVDSLLPDGVSREFIAHESALESPCSGPFYDAIRTILGREVPCAAPVPFCTGGGTDAKTFAHLGILGYGFAPSCPGPQGQEATGAHGVDERVPVASLEFAHRILRALLEWT